MNTSKINDDNVHGIKKTNTKKVNTTHKLEYVNGKTVQRMNLCQVFTRMTYANVIIGAVLYLITMITLFGARVNDPNNLWLGFWVLRLNNTVLSAFAITVISLDSLWLASYATQLVANIVLHNKVKLIYVPAFLIALSVSILLMLILGGCCMPAYLEIGDISSWIYISWMRTLTIKNVGFSTSLTSGAIIILLEIVLIYVACIGYTIYYHTYKIKKNKLIK